MHYLTKVIFKIVRFLTALVLMIFIESLTQPNILHNAITVTWYIIYCTSYQFIRNDHY